MKLYQWLRKVKEADLIEQVDVYDEGDYYEFEIRFDLLIGIRDSYNTVNCHFIRLNTDVIDGIQKLIRSFLKEMWITILDEEEDESWMCRDDEEYYPADHLTWTLKIQKDHHSKVVMKEFE